MKAFSNSVGENREKMNVEHTTDVADAETSLVPNAKRLLDFDPVRDGFWFANIFAWTDDDLSELSSQLGPLIKGIGMGFPAILGKAFAGRLGFISGLVVGATLSFSKASNSVLHAVARRWRTFGLCGGMALLAKERWGSATDEPTIELDRDSIRPILRLHQAQTIRASWPRFLKYWLQALASRGVFAAEELWEESWKAMAEIDEGRLAIIGLVGDTPDPFATHQVVAFGYEEQLAEIDFHVYDPNAPGRVRHVVVRKKEDQTVIETDMPTGPKKQGGYHISKTEGSLSMLFVVEA